MTCHSLPAPLPSPPHKHKARGVGRSVGRERGPASESSYQLGDTAPHLEVPRGLGSPDRGLCHHGGQIPSISANPTCLLPPEEQTFPGGGPHSDGHFHSLHLEWSGGCRGDALAEMPSVKPRAQLAFKNSMIRGILQFTLRIAFRCVLHRCRSQDIRC